MRDDDVLKYYKEWDVNEKLCWTVEKDVPISWQITNVILTTWKFKATKIVADQGRGKDLTMKIPHKQINIIKASYDKLVSLELE